MPSPTTTKLPIPKSWDEFEDIVSDVLRARWSNPHVTRNGRSGQKQHGVDIYARAAHLANRYAGAQCKLVDALSEREVSAIVDEAEQFRPRLAEFLIATSAARDAVIQSKVRELNETRIAAGRFPVEILFWDDISLDLSGDKKLLAKHFPDWARLNADEEPDFALTWIVAEEFHEVIRVPALPTDVTDLLGALDPYTEEELAYLRHVNPSDAVKAADFNTAVRALAADPGFRDRWRASQAAYFKFDGMQVGVAVSVNKAAASDILVELEFDDDLCLLRGDDRPRPEEVELPEHPRLESERRYARSSLYDQVLGETWATSIVGRQVDAFYPMIHVPRPISLHVDGSIVSLRIDRLAPRRTQRFTGDAYSIVVAPWCEAGPRTVRWSVDAENLTAPQDGELKLVVEPGKKSMHRRRQSYIGEPLQFELAERGD